MKNSLIVYILFSILQFLNFINAFANDSFIFNVTELEISDNGNLYKGLKKGSVSSSNGIVISADEFVYKKDSNELKATGNVEVIDKLSTDRIFSNSITYLKNKEIIYSTGNSKALVNNLVINGDVLEFKKKNNVFKIKKNVRIDDIKNNNSLFSDHIVYNKNKETFFSKGSTKAIIDQRYNFYSSNLYYLRNELEIYSNDRSEIKDKINHYKLSKFNYDIFKKELVGEKILVTTNYKLPKSDKYFFDTGFFNLKKNEFIAQNIKILLEPLIFGEKDNNPRIKGVSSSSKNGVTTINKGIFTSCNIDSDCTPWYISASKITHDKNKKQLTYDDAVLRIYDVPVAYFPKFFHPDPTVERQSGFLKPQINSSNILGDSIYVPYFHVISDNKDLTFQPTFFSDSMQMLRNEYRQKNKNSELIADISLTKGYKSKLSNKKNSLTHLFTKFKSNLNLESYQESELDLSIQKVSNDTYLKVFDSNLIESEIKPEDPNNLTSELKLSLSNDDSNFVTGIQSFENLGLKNSDRYQYILPYYNYNKNIDLEFLKGDLNFRSNGSNDLNNTNELKTRVINDLEYKSEDLISKRGFVNNFNVYFKNLGTIGKNSNTYKSSPQLELMNLYEVSSKYPLYKNTDKFNNTLIPKVSLRVNPSDMKNYTNENRNINTDNLFNINRLGLSDTFEKGKSLTIGIDYKKESLEDINKHFELKLGSVFRDDEENFIPKTSTLNKKNSNVFGSINSTLGENFSLDYDFMIDNNLDKIEYNSVGAIWNFGNLQTKFNYVKENGEVGDENFLENTTSFNYNDKNSFSFKTRRNRKINLTEFYDLVYEYKNDCLTAGIKYNKTYYSDRDLKPKEDLLFTLTLFPLTTYEHKQSGF